MLSFAGCLNAPYRLFLPFTIGSISGGESNVEAFPLLPSRNATPITSLGSRSNELTMRASLIDYILTVAAMLYILF